MNKSLIAAILGTILFVVLAISVPLMSRADITNNNNQHKITLYSGGIKIG